MNTFDSYNQELFEVQHFDYEKIEIDPSYNKVIEFVQSIPFTIEWLSNVTNGLDLEVDKEDILTKCLRKVNMIAGFCRIFHLKKLQHLFDIMVFIFSHARDLGTLSNHSFDYLIKLILEKAQSISRDLESNYESMEDISSIIEEASLYCKPLITATEFQSEDSYTKSIDVHSAMEDSSVGYSPKDKEFHKSSPVIDIIPEFGDSDDEPEELEIPPDKMGLISDFYEESLDHLTKLGNGLLDLENDSENRDIVNDLFRSMHTLKGGARLLNIKKMERLTHISEELLDKIRKGNIKISSNIIDVLLESKKRIQSILDEIASKGPIRTRIVDIIQILNRITIGDPQPEISHSKPRQEAIPVSEQSRSESDREIPRLNTGKVEKIQSKSNEFIRVNTDKLDEVINYSSELSITRIQFENEFASINKLMREWKKTCERIESQDLAIFYNRLENANKLFIDEYNASSKAKGGESLDPKAIHSLKKFQNELKAEIDAIELTLTEEAILSYISLQEVRNNILRSLENLNLLTSRLQSGVMNFRMVPISSLFERFPTLIRDLAKQCNKSVVVKIEGGDTELDRTIINHLTDPMIHLLRNSIDHGIEDPEERITKGKSQNGNIFLRAFYQGSYAVIEIRDDGKGIDKNRVIQIAIEKGIFKKEDIYKLDDSEVFNLIFHPGFSTKEQVSELSGRGVGMDVVKSHIQSLQGEIEVKSTQGVGTQIFLRLPLTLAVVRVLLYEISGNIFAFPMANVFEILSISKSSLETIGDRVLFRWNNEYIPVVKMSAILDIPGGIFNNDEIEIIILEEGGRKLALMVDNLLGRQEIVIKNLGNILEKVPFIMGCTILSDRRIVLVLNPKEVLDEGLMVSETPQKNLIAGLHLPKNHILIVDDSSIHRQQLKTILTREGYHVDEAENGFEALKLVRLKSYKILCVDIVMPLMDGFELTRRLRNLPLYRAIPIFLITSSNTREDRDRGYKIGANEFFEKPIDPGPILEKIQSYIDKESIQ